MTRPSFNRRDYALKEGSISACHFGDLDKPVRLILLHANGFNAQSYRTVLEKLNIHSLALDLRGHGFSTLPYDPEDIRSFHQFRDDVTEFVERYIDSDFIMTGHSLGACVGMLCGPQLIGQVKGYVGFDPPIMPQWMRPFFYIPGWIPMMQNHLPIAAAAGRRRSVFDDLEQAFERYKGRGVFKRFSDEALRDYLEGGLRPNGNKMKLACDPKWEQAIFPAHHHDVFKAAKSLPNDNSKVYFATIGAPNTPLSRARMRAVIGKRNVRCEEGFNHMFPLNEPNFAAKVLQEAIDRAEFKA